MGKFDNFNTDDIINRTLQREEGINEKLELIQTDSITPNPHQPRKIFNDNDIKELSNSIEKVGLLQPIVVKEDNKGEYSLIMGERRLRAIKLLRHNTVKAIVIKQNDFDVIVTALAENTHRTNLKPIEEALALNKILQLKNCSKKELAKIVSRSYDHTVSLLSIVNLPEEIQTSLLEEDTTISIQTLQALSRVKDKEKAILFFKQIIEKKLNKKESLALILEKKDDTISDKKMFVSDTNIDTNKKNTSQNNNNNHSNNNHFVVTTDEVKTTIIIEIEKNNTELLNKIIKPIKELINKK